MLRDAKNELVLAAPDRFTKEGEARLIIGLHRARPADAWSATRARQAIATVTENHRTQAGIWH
jgi:hypothetical protein